ncbi:Proline-rich protein PRCC [Phaffia rhodozyma]|uniref:Proline-rich protein PRCC n=1 Tax=Phaffia rhodozyma TaxID=264483 RepID=A0A0F7SFH8_PHARH|nr:Proline-rich protein PRCC [Phaffia rhodozyma]
MALVDYVSDSDSEGSDQEVAAPAVTKAAPSKAISACTVIPSTAHIKRAISPPRAPIPSASGSGLALPPPKSNIRKRPAPKFTIEAASDADTSATATSGSNSVENPVAKKPKQTPAGSSALLSMLPPPKQALPKPKAMPAPVRLKPLEVDAEGRVESFERVVEEDDGTGGHTGEVIDFSRKGPVGEPKRPVIVRPLDTKANGGSSAKSKSKEAPLMDFFGITASTSSVPSAASLSNTSAPPKISSAPQLPTFRPPSPTRLDPYPGYYALPSGEWAAHDRAYYDSYYRQWREEDEAASGGKEGSNWDALDQGREIVDEIDVRGMGAKDEDRLPGAAPRAAEAPPTAVKKNLSKPGQRNQLSALIQNAQSNREALEEQIAKAKRNKRASGQVYGFR